MLVLMLMSMLMSHASVDLFVLSFVLPCAYAYVASENQALSLVFTSDISISTSKTKDKTNESTEACDISIDISISTSIRLRA